MESPDAGAIQQLEIRFQVPKYPIASFLRAICTGMYFILRIVGSLVRDIDVHPRASRGLLHHRQLPSLAIGPRRSQDLATSSISSCVDTCITLGVYYICIHTCNALSHAEESTG